MAALPREGLLVTTCSDSLYPRPSPTIGTNDLSRLSRSVLPAPKGQRKKGQLKAKIVVIDTNPKTPM